MKAGLLVCDHINRQYEEEFGDYTAMFEALFPEFDFVFYDVCNGHFPENLEDCDLYMATGSRHSVYEDIPWIVRTKELIQQLYKEQKYFVGFCFGHQLLGEALGGKVQKSPKGWCVGVHKFDVLEQPKWMQPSQNSLNLLMMCQDQVLELPKNAKTLAGNEQCPIGIMQVGEKMLGIQAHPEFSKAYNQILMEARIQRMGQEVVEKGIASLTLPIHRTLIRQWVFEFIS